MKSWAVTKAGHPLEQIESPDPERASAAAVVIEVTHCGVCHSDVHFWEGFLNIGDKKVPVEAIGMKTPYVLGHEIVGRVVDIGSDVTNCKVGDTRLVYPWVGCGDCAECAAKNGHLCANPQTIGVRRTGGFATQISIPDQRYLVDIGDLDPALAATYACSGLTVYSAIQKLMPMEPDRAIVLIGAGGLGLNAVAILKALGHKNIVVLDVSERNREAALQLGATIALDSRNAETNETLKQLSNGSVTAIIDLVNSAVTAKLAFDVLGKGGKLVQVGLFGGTLELPLMMMPTRGISIIGNYVGSPKELRDLIKLARDGKVGSIPISRHPRSHVSQALTDLRDGQIKGRIVLDSTLPD